MRGVARRGADVDERPTLRAEADDLFVSSITVPAFVSLKGGEPENLCERERGFKGGNGGKDNAVGTVDPCSKRETMSGVSPLGSRRVTLPSRVIDYHAVRRTRQRRRFRQSDLSVGLPHGCLSSQPSSGLFPIQLFPRPFSNIVSIESQSTTSVPSSE